MLLDTNAISAWAKDEAELWNVLRGDRPWYLPRIALGEYRYGLLKSNRRLELERWLAEVETNCVVLATDAVTAQYYAKLRLAIEPTGVDVPYHDLWICPLSLQYDCEVVSRDAHFDLMPGVRRLGW